MLFAIFMTPLSHNATCLCCCLPSLLLVFVIAFCFPVFMEGLEGFMELTLNLVDLCYVPRFNLQLPIHQCIYIFLLLTNIINQNFMRYIYISR